MDKSGSPMVYLIPATIALLIVGGALGYRYMILKTQQPAANAPVAKMDIKLEGAITPMPTSTVMPAPTLAVLPTSAPTPTPVAEIRALQQMKAASPEADFTDIQTDLGQL